MEVVITPESVRFLRLRLGWVQADLARRLECATSEVEAIEKGDLELFAKYRSEIERISGWAEECTEEMQALTQIESALDDQRLEQIEFARVIAELE